MTVTPGSHVIRQGDFRVAMGLEVEGYDVRDCIHVITCAGVEQWWLARWPFTGNTIQNLVKHGVGALDIERCRVNTPIDYWPASRNYGPGQKIPGGFGKVVKTGEAPAGRWPPNLVFLHAEGCKRVGEKKVKASQDRGLEQTQARSWKNASKAGINRVGYAGTDGKETVPEYECVEGCPVATLDVMSGVIESHAGHTRMHHGGMGYGGGKGSERVFESSSGGASRFFPCFESRAELQAWFNRLLAVDPV